MNDLFTFTIQQRLKEPTTWDKLDQLIEWKRLETLIQNGLKKTRKTNAGRKGFDTLKHVKALLLGQWHNLSDPGLEQALKIRLDFITFCGFELHETPDETTLCKFRNKLIAHDLLEPLLEEVNAQLEEHSIKVKQAEAAIVDATIITSAGRPKKEVTYEQLPEDRHEEDRAEELEPDVSYGKDKDARWLKKGRRYEYGYKGFVRVDEEDGFVEKVEVHAAHVSEMGLLEEMIEGSVEGQRILADKGYASKANREMLKNHRFKCGVMYKAARNHPLSKRQQQFNRLVSKKRWLVEQCFGTLKRGFGLSRARYMGRAKVKGELILKSICYNLLKASHRVTVTT